MSVTVQGYSQTAIVEAYAKAMPMEYILMAGITIVVYDSLILFHRELEYIYKGRQTLIKWIYLVIKIAALIVFIINFAAYLIPPQTPTVCLVRHWFSVFLFEILNGAIIKTLLVIRLGALYRNNKSVMALLFLANAVELIITTFSYVFTGLNLQRAIASPAPIPGCTLRPETHLPRFQSQTLLWAARFTSNSLELVFLLVGLYQNLKETGSRFGKGWIRIRQVAPILYVFYRDGTIFYIPVCALSLFGFVATLTSLGFGFACSNWETWLGIIYYIAGTRLILNIRQTGFKFSESMITGQVLSTFVFRVGEEFATEGDLVTADNPRAEDMVVLEVSGSTNGSFIGD